jgi:FtsP/CotA-like multicopper oxidase with cupredoxin domain
MVEFNLQARDGYFSIPDGNSIYFQGFGEGGQELAQLPGPWLIVNQGEMVTVNLTNTLDEPVSIMFPGQKGVKANGSPVQPRYLNGELVSLVDYAEPGGTISYTFVPENPGTFIYESGTTPHIQVPLGLYILLSE